MAVDTSFVIGYGGWATIEFQNNGKKIFLPLINGNVQKNINVSFVTSYDIPFSEQTRSKIRLNTGTYQFVGNINFQLTTNILQTFFDNCNENTTNDFFSRKSLFDLQLCDGEKIIILKKCVWNSFTLNVNPSQIVKADMSFASVNNYKENFEMVDAQICDIQITEKDAPLKYWKFGNSDYGQSIINSFSMSFARNVQPMYLNNDLKMPTYFRIGILDCTIQVTCLQDWFYYTAFKLDTKTFTLLNYYKTQQNWQLNGLQSQGYKTYTIKGSNKSTKQVFRIA